jgi:hypothetical protein
MPPALVRLSCGIALTLLAAAASHAQMMFDHARTRVGIEGYANTTAGRSLEDTARRSTDARLDAGLRVVVLERVTETISLGVRAEALSSPEDKLQAGERTVAAIGPWGRFEVGNRQSFPVPIVGYGPNNYTFTSSEYGVPSGRRLDPGGTLATSFLSASLAAQIDRLSTLGFASTLFRDLSRKLVYVVPKTHGFQAGVAYSPDAEQQRGRYRELLQVGLTHETFLGQSSYKIGGTLAHARGNAALGYDDLTSVSLGVSAVVLDNWTFGVAFTYDGESGLTHTPASAYKAPAFGMTSSVDYNIGPWTVGGYLQRAQSAGEATQPGSDRLTVFQIGLSYRVNVHVRCYGVAYRYRFDNEGGALASDRFRGTVLLAGVRLAL